MCIYSCFIFFYSYTYKRFHYVTLVIQTTPTAVFRGCWTDGVRLEGRDMNNHEHHCSAMPAPYSFMGVFAHLSRAQRKSKSQNERKGMTGNEKEKGRNKQTKIINSLSLGSAGRQNVSHGALLTYISILSLHHSNMVDEQDVEQNNPVKNFPHHLGIQFFKYKQKHFQSYQLPSFQRLIPTCWIFNYIGSQKSEISC